MFRFPWTNEHELNLDWIIREIKRLAKKVDSGGSGPVLSDLPPQDLGSRSAGISDECSRADHVHQMPTAADIGAQEKFFAPGSGIDAVYQIVEGDLNEASGAAAFAIGSRTVASGVCSFAAGTYTGGNKTTASGNHSIALGLAAVASGNSSFACGQQPAATAPISQAVGNHTISAGRACFVAGQYNEEDANPIDTSHGTGARKFIMIIGNGTADNARSNAMELDWDGVLTLSGGLAVEEITVSANGAVSRELQAGKIYHFTGALTSLDITLATPPTGVPAQYHFDFDSGSTPPTVTFPIGVIMQGGAFSPTASSHCEVDILNRFGVYAEW